MLGSYVQLSANKSVVRGTLLRGVCAQQYSVSTEGGQVVFSFQLLSGRVSFNLATLCHLA
jgi:hypothetical protein